MTDTPDDIITENTEDMPESEIQAGLGMVLAADSLPDVLPLLPLSERPAFPGMMLPVMIPKGPTAEAAYTAATADSQAIGLVLTKKSLPPDSLPDSPELYSYGTAAKILKVQKTDQNEVQLLLSALKRFRIRKMIKNGPEFVATVQYYDEPVPEDDDETHALALAIIGEIKHIGDKSPLFSEEVKLIISQTASIGEPGRLADMAWPHP